MSGLTTNKLQESFLLVFSSLLLLVACGGESASSQSSSAPAPVASNVSAADVAVDANIKAQVESALANASDLPQAFTVEVSEGVVLISGSMVCEDCGGMRTPGNVGTVQQSLGGVVRAVPGVMRVDFDLSYGSD
ncbi:MAG: hypothetical protein GKR91_19055 [Pseudomonadales bacterium]|nr:hypothetical protein [Pseudomonadales bacterium]